MSYGKKWSPRDKDQDKVFFDTIRSTGNIRAACRASGYEYMQVYYWRGKLPIFSKKWDEAMTHAQQHSYSYNRRRSAYGPMPNRSGGVDEVILRATRKATKGREARDLGR